MVRKKGRRLSSMICLFSALRSPGPSAPQNKVEKCIFNWYFSFATFGGKGKAIFATLNMHLELLITWINSQIEYHLIAKICLKTRITEIYLVIFHLRKSIQVYPYESFHFPCFDDRSGQEILKGQISSLQLTKINADVSLCTDGSCN